MLAPDCKAIHYMAQTLKIINDDIKAGIDGIETDIRVTSDGVYVMQHNATVNGVDISQSTYSECKAAYDALLTFNEVLAIQKENNLIAVYESKINDSHAHNIVDAIINSGVNLEDTFIEPHAKNLTSNYTAYDSRINVVWKNGVVSDAGIADAAQYLTGNNKVVFSINLYLENQKDFDDSWVTKMRNLGLGLAADPVASESGVELYSQYPFDQVWGPADIVVPMRDKYRQRDSLGVYDVDGEDLSSTYDCPGSFLLRAYDVNGVIIFDNVVPPSPGDYDEWTTEYEHTILLARNAWASEYRADNTIVPFVLTTDQHGLLDPTIAGSTYGGALYKYLSKAIKWDEVSASFNLGDVCGGSFSDSSLTSMEQKLSVIPAAKRISVPGNHDVDGIRDDSDAMDSVFTQYFDNSGYNGFSRFEKRGFETMVDQAHHIRYVVLGSWYYNAGASMSSYRISSAAIEWLIDVLESDSTNDIVIVSHIQPANGTKRTTRPQVDGKQYRIAYSGYNAVGGDSLRMQDLLIARKNKTSGTITDTDGVVHTFDFSGCTTDLLCTLHGHAHVDFLHYHCGVPTYTFDSYKYNTTGLRPVYFGNIDRTQQRIKLWKVEYDCTIQNIVIPFIEHYNPCTGIAYPNEQKNVTLTVGESMTLTPIISTEYEDDGTYPIWVPNGFSVRLKPAGKISQEYVSVVNKGLDGGIITGNKAGTSVVTVSCGSFSDTCYVTVVDPPEEANEEEI